MPEVMAVRLKRRIRRCLWVSVLFLVLLALDPRMVVRRYTVESDKVDAPIRLALLTDFHGCNYGKDASRLIAAVDAEHPDVVLLVGDIFDDNLSWDASEALVSTLASRYPCYYVTGNHEYWSGRAAEIEQIVERAGATVLNQTCAVLTVQGQQINLCGIPDPYAGVNTSTALARAAAAIPQEGFTVLLAHRPELIETYAASGAFDLVVSGHAHGGQVRIPGLLNGLYAPHQGFFPSYAGGLYTVDTTVMVVSRGLARESTRLPRVFNRPELVIITLE